MAGPAADRIRRPRRAPGLTAQAQGGPVAIRRYLPILEWGRGYSGEMLASDLLAAGIVTIMLVPQSLAYAMLAGLPPVYGLYASILPLLAYTLFGTSRTLAVGPVAVISLMTATAASTVAAPGTAAYVEAAITLAFLSGVILAVMGLLRLGFLANLLSHPVVSAFITASALLIATSQLKHLLGIDAGGETMVAMLRALAGALSAANAETVLIGGVTLAFLFWSRKGLKPLFSRLGLGPKAADLLARTGPAVAVVLSIVAVVQFDLVERGVATVGAIPQGLPPLTVPSLAPDLVTALMVPALLIALVGFVESVSVAQTLAARRRQRIVPDQELVALGSANIAGAFSGGFPVTGGFARSVVNFDAGAQTPAAGAFTAAGIAIATVWLTPALAPLPNAVLAATIVVAVLSLADWRMPRTLWRYSRADFSAWAATVAITLLVGVEAGVVTGVLVSLALYLWRASRPHAAIVGQVPGTEHYRNIARHEVVTDPAILTIRVDESLTYLNARWLEEFILEQVAERPAVRYLILMASAINAIDASALEALEAINERLRDSGVELHLTEVKGPVMDRLQRTGFLEHLTGRVWLSQHQACLALRGTPFPDPEPGPPAHAPLAAPPIGAPEAARDRG
jgi:SulP family sulfate permease